MSYKKISQLPASTAPLAGTEELAVVQSGVTKKVTVANLTTGRTVNAAELNVNGAEGSLVSFTNNIGSGKRPSLNIGISLGFNASGGFGESNLMWGTGGAIPTFKIQSWDGTTLTNQFVLDTSGNANLTLGNLVIGTAGKGIDFSADGQAAGMTSELLDDYEEGTWTPSRVGFTETLNGGSITSTGTYTKVGNLVQIHCDIICAGGATIAGVGNVSYFTGQPFTSSLGASGSYSIFATTDFGGMLINTGNLFVVNTTFTTTSNQIVFDCTYRI